MVYKYDDSKADPTGNLLNIQLFKKESKKIRDKNNCQLKRFRDSKKTEKGHLNVEKGH